MNYNTLAPKNIIQKTIKNLETNSVHAILVENQVSALEQIKTLIPKDASVMNGSSITLEQIGFVDYLKTGNHGWNNLHKAIAEEKDPIKQSTLRKQALLSDYYLGSVHALSQTGEFIIASNTGSQLSHIVFSSPNCIFVVGVQKIVPTLSDALKRLDEYVLPLEEKHMIEKYGVGTFPSKIVIFKKENPMLQRNVHMILVNQVLGF